eukprot:6127512-Pleurochrysis_carterae.AAC.1
MHHGYVRLRAWAKMKTSQRHQDNEWVRACVSARACMRVCARVLASLLVYVLTESACNREQLMRDGQK